MHIFFDVDGVLIDGFHFNPERRNRWDKNLERDLGINVDHFSSSFIRGPFMEVLHGRLDFEEELEIWLKKNDHDVKAWQVIKYWHEADSKINQPLFDIVTSLSTRDDISLYIATNQSRARAHYLWETLGFKNHFKDIYYSARLGCLKQDANYFAQIERELKLDPIHDTILYFDDDPNNIEVASARGWQAVLFDTTEDAAKHPDIVRLMLEGKARNV